MDRTIRCPRCKKVKNLHVPIIAKCDYPYESEFCTKCKEEMLSLNKEEKDVQ